MKDETKTAQEFKNKYEAVSRFENIRMLVEGSDLNGYQRAKAAIEYATMASELNQQQSANASLKKQNEELVEALKNAKNDLQWTWDNMGTPHTSDHFNIPANGIHQIEELLSKHTT